MTTTLIIAPSRREGENAAKVNGVDEYTIITDLERLRGRLLGGVRVYMLARGWQQRYEARVQLYDAVYARGGRIIWV